tara:strand:- start:2007 stop:2789 length:783 start_codon:yes stop_codon:yes gene_type:complete
MGLEGKTIAGSYKDLLHLSNNGSGVSATNIHVVKDGNGTNTSLQVGKRGTLIKGHADTTLTFQVSDSSNNAVLNVNTTDKAVTAGTTLTNVTTQIQKFGVYDLQPTADTHHAMYSDAAMTSISGSIDFGTGVDPATTYTLSSSEANANSLVASIWYIPTAITVDEVRVIAAGEAADTLNFHLYSYDMASGTGSGAGDLSNGAVVASTGSTLTTGNDRVTTTTLTIDSANVAADKVIIATVENVGATTDVTAQLIVKYHYQ